MWEFADYPYNSAFGCSLRLEQMKWGDTHLRRSLQLRFGFRHSRVGAGALPAQAMEGYHTLTLFVPAPRAQFVALFYRLLTGDKDTYERTPMPENPYTGNWDAVMFASADHHDLFEVYLCRGNHFEQLALLPGTKGYHFEGYMSVYSMLWLYWHAFQTGHYVEVLALAVDTHDDVAAELYVRVPSTSADVYAVLPSFHEITEVHQNDYRYDRPERMWCKMWRAPSMQGFKLPSLNLKPLGDIGSDWQTHHLRAITDPDLYDDVYKFASMVYWMHYGVDRLHGETVVHPNPQDRAIPTAICRVLKGEVPDEAYGELKRALEAGPAHLLQ